MFVSVRFTSGGESLAYYALYIKTFVIMEMICYEGKFHKTESENHRLGVVW